MNFKNVSSAIQNEHCVILEINSMGICHLPQTKTRFNFVKREQAAMRKSTINQISTEQMY